MKKKILLISMALFSFCAGTFAQKFTVKTEPEVLKPGESGFFVVDFVDVDDYFYELPVFQVTIPIVKGIVPGDVKDLDVAGLLDMNALDIYKISENNGYNLVLAMSDGKDYDIVYPGETSFQVRLPIMVEADAEEGETVFSMQDLESDVIVGYCDRQYFYDGDDVTVTIKISSSETPEPKVYGAVTYAGSVTSYNGYSTIEDLKEALRCDNTIVYFYDDDIPAEWAELTNVVVNGVAKKIDLWYCHPFNYNGGPIEADSAQFNIENFSNASREGGWISVFVPFDGTPNVTPITKADRRAGKYWVKEYVKSDEEALYYKDLDNPVFKAHVPYLFAFPGSDYGEYEVPGNWHMTISAADVLLFDGFNLDYPLSYNEPGDYTMMMTYRILSEPHSWLLIPEMNMFKYYEDAEEYCTFSAYAQKSNPILSAPRLRSLAIRDIDDADKGYTSAPELSLASLVVYADNGDIVISASNAGKTAVYNMNGQVVSASVVYGEGETRISGLAAGAYIVAGQKVVLTK